MADERELTDEQKADPKMVAHFLERSAVRLWRLLEINAPLIIVQREIEVAGNRLRILQNAFGVDVPDLMSEGVRGVEGSK